jgi:hypothetical protein
VALIGNQWKTLNADVAALEDRGHLLVFEPTPWEVHQQAARWFWDTEIFDFVADHLHLIDRHSLRIYGQAWELKQAGLEWRRAVLGRYLSGAALEVARLKANPAFASEAERVKAFIQSGAGCRATYFNLVKKLQPVEARPKLTLPHTASPADPADDFYNRLRRRFGDLHFPWPKWATARGRQLLVRWVVSRRHRGIAAERVQQCHPQTQNGTVAGKGGDVGTGPLRARQPCTRIPALLHLRAPRSATGTGVGPQCAAILHPVAG